MRALGVAAALLIGALGFRLSAQSPSQSAPVPEPFPGVLDEHPVIGYRTGATSDLVARLREQLARGTRSLEHRERGGYLQSVLDALNISSESQLLVFSRTGVQGAVTGPKTPRALYFNDSVVVGYIAGAPFLELAAHDPEQGVVFYTIDQLGGPKPGNAGRDYSAPAIARRVNCLSCHVSGSTMEVPGMITRSMFTERNGDTIPQLGSYLVDHRTPLPQRWGGYFVTSTNISPIARGVEHMGNSTTTIHPTSGPAGTSNDVLIEWLASAPETLGYPSAQSDIAALMLFDHQMHAINLLTRLNWESRVAQAEGRVDFAHGVLAQLAEEVVDYFLFVGEVPPPARLTPREGFAARFAAAARRDRHGRSLRDLDLERRLLRYPCSYMIDSEAFDHLPAAAKRAVYDRIDAVLTGRDTRSKYQHLSADRATILEILRDTRHLAVP